MVSVRKDVREERIEGCDRRVDSRKVNISAFSHKNTYAARERTRLDYHKIYRLGLVYPARVFLSQGCLDRDTAGDRT